MKVIVETLNYDEYVTYDNRRSEIDSDRFIKRFISFTCPHCKTIWYGRLEPFCPRICTECGLQVTLSGDKIDCKLVKH